MLYSIVESKEIIKYQYDLTLNIVNIYIKPSDLTHIKNYIMDVPFDPKDVVNAYAWDILYELEQGEQHWLDGNATYIEKEEYDNKEYILFAKLYSCSLYYDNETKIIGYSCDTTKDNNFNNNCKYFSKNL